MRTVLHAFTMLFALAATFAADAADTRRNTVGMHFVYIPPGEFYMGSSDSDLELVSFEMATPNASLFDDERPRHKVRITKGYWLGRTEVTQDQWLKVMNTRPGPADHWRRPDWRTLPVVSVSWNMAQEFVAILSLRDKQYNYRLPSEAEWEYAARAGSEEIRPMPNGRLEEYAWLITNSGDVPQPVATRKPNAFGLFDTLGNAWEWVADRYSEDTYSVDMRVDPRGPSDGQRRLRRGGSYHCPLHETRPGFRSPDPHPDIRYTVTGFRLVAEEK